MKLEDMFHINNFLKKSNTDHQVRHFSREIVEKFKRMMQRQKLTEADYSKIMDDEETIKRIRADIKKDLSRLTDLIIKNQKKLVKSYILAYNYI